jgi:hypothetical protein
MTTRTVRTLPSVTVGDTVDVSVRANPPASNHVTSSRPVVGTT